MNIKTFNLYLYFFIFLFFSQKILMAQNVDNLLTSQSTLMHNDNELTIDFDDFGKEFTFTYSTDDYLRSIQRIKKKYFFKILPNKKLRTFEKINESKKNEIKTLVNVLSKEAWLKTDFQYNKFYLTLEKLTKFGDKLKYSAIIEIALVDEQRKLLKQSIGKTLTKDETYFKHLIQHARYEVLKYSLYKHFN